VTAGVPFVAVVDWFAVALL
jgi:hypothetical protein